MTFPAFRQEDALQVGVTIELDAEHVEYFPLQPVRGGPDGRRCWKRLAVGDHGFHAHPFISLKRIEYPDQVKLLFTLGIMHSSDVDAVIKPLLISHDLEKFGSDRGICHDVVLTEVG